MSEVEKEEEKEEMVENVENFLEALKDVDLIMLNFTEIYKNLESQDKNKVALDKNQIFELGENIGVIKAYMKLLSQIYHNINKNVPKEIVTEMIKNLDSFSSILINLQKNDINNLKNLELSLEQRMLTFFDVTMEFLDSILRK